MARFFLSKKAVEDMSAIWNYTLETWSEDQADKYYNMLIAFCKQLADSPSVGKKYDEIKEGLFGFRAGKHIIFYIILKTGVEIVRILHQRMDLKNRIRE